MLIFLKMLMKMTKMLRTTKHNMNTRTTIVVQQCPLESLRSAYGWPTPGYYLFKPPVAEHRPHLPVVWETWRGLECWLMLPGSGVVLDDIGLLVIFSGLMHWCIFQDHLKTIIITLPILYLLHIVFIDLFLDQKLLVLEVICCHALFKLSSKLCWLVFCRFVFLQIYSSGYKIDLHYHLIGWGGPNTASLSSHMWLGMHSHSQSQS